MECVNTVLKQFLQASISHQQDNWSLWLPLTQLATNNHQSKTTDVTPFFANNGCHSHLNFNIMEQRYLLENNDAQEYATKQQEIYKLIQGVMSFAQVKQQENADGQCNPAHTYQVGDLVMLNARDIIVRCPSVKLDHKTLVPFPILAYIRKYACCPQLP
jgi:hypothetical protein